MSTAIAMSHAMFDGMALLGICDKIVPGLLIGALHFGHLPCVFVPAGPMATGLSNHEKSRVREQAAQGLNLFEHGRAVAGEQGGTPPVCGIRIMHIP